MCWLKSPQFCQFCKRSLLFIAMQVSVYSSRAQYADSLVSIQNLPIFKSLFSKPNLEVILEVRHQLIKTSFSIPYFIYRDFYVIQNPKGVFLCLIGASRVYRLVQENDSLLIFRRNDNLIENINYNISALYITHKGNIYNYAGYGFWKTNGLLRKYNELSREWDNVPLNKEVHNIFVHPHSWKAEKSHKVYIFFEQWMNEGLKDPQQVLRVVPKSYILDISTGNISDLGTISNTVLENLLKVKKLVHTPEGVLLLRHPDAYYLKPLENKYYAITDNSIIQTLERGSLNGLSYYHNGKIFFSTMDYNTLDSLSVAALPLKEVGRIWVNPAERYVIISGVIGLLMGFLIWAFIYFKKRRRKYSVPIRKNNPPLIPVPVLSEAEVALLQMLIKKTLEGDYASSNEINYMIGCKDKNIGLQKKMRSDIINGINAKYKLFSKQEEPLIESQRTEADKRYFQYAIKVEFVEQAQNFIEITKTSDA